MLCEDDVNKHWNIKKLILTLLKILKKIFFKSFDLYRSLLQHLNFYFESINASGFLIKKKNVSVNV